VRKDPFLMLTQGFALGYHLSPLRGSALFGVDILNSHPFAKSAKKWATHSV
jgi:hypothetical protein